MLLQVKIDFQSENTASGVSVQGTSTGLIDMRCGASYLATLVMRAQSMNPDLPGGLHENMPTGCRESLYKHGNEVTVDRNLIKVQGKHTLPLKTLYNRKTKTRNNVTVTITPAVARKVERLRYATK